MERSYFFVLLPIFVFLFRFLIQRYTRRNLPPGPAGFPIVGSLPQLGANLHESLFHLAKHHGSLMTLYIGSVRTVVASSTEAARGLIGKNDRAISDRMSPDSVTAQPNYLFSIGSSPGDNAWRNLRRFCTSHLYSSRQLDALEQVRHEKVQRLLSHIKKTYQKSGEPVEIGKVVYDTTMNVISNMIFSADIGDIESKEAKEFRDLFSSIIEYAVKPNISDNFPLLRPFDLQGIKKHLTSLYERLHRKLDDIIDKRVEGRADGTVTRDNDFLDALLDQCQEVGSGFDRQKIKPLLAEMFTAGVDTTAIAIEWVMTELLRKPSLLQKAKEELLTVVGTEKSVQESDTDKLPYLQAIVKETMRLHPPGPLLLPYKAKTDIEVLGYLIPEGTQVIVNAWAIARDPNYWIEPTEFCPERFMGSSIDYKGQNFEYIPFGAGRRICPGIPLASRMVHLVVASLVHAFTWKLPGGTLPEELDMEEKFGVTLRKAIPLCAIPQ